MDLFWLVDLIDIFDRLIDFFWMNLPLIAGGTNETYARRGCFGCAIFWLVVFHH